MTPIETPYLIVGAGPVGLTAARLLGNAGRDCLVVERRDGPLRHPAAHVVNARTLEIFRQAELDMDAIDRLAKDPVDTGHVDDRGGDAGVGDMLRQRVPETAAPGLQRRHPGEPDLEGLVVDDRRRPEVEETSAAVVSLPCRR